MRTRAQGSGFRVYYKGDTTLYIKGRVPFIQVKISEPDPLILGMAVVCALLAGTVGRAQVTYTDRPAQGAATAAAPEPRYLGGDPEVVGAAMLRTNGSLLRATVASHANGSPRPVSVSFMAVPEPLPRTIKKHDFVTVIVSENSDSSSKATTDLKKNEDFVAQLTQFIRLRPSNFQIEGRTPAVAPGINASGNRDFKGEATADRSDSFTIRQEAEVIDVKPNGNLVLQSTKHVQNDEEEVYVTLTGVCRAEDVTPDNTVLSTQLVNLDVVKKTKGAVRDTSKRGFIPKLLDQINPF
jgi:flagellar L-ring protein FlgH